MYKNPLYNGDYSDYNLLKNQRDVSSIINKYSSRTLRQGEATEQLKYFEYLTYQQPILDELIYLAERIKNENIQKQKEDYIFIQKMQQERENQFREFAKLQKDSKEIISDLFGEVPISKDETPTIKTELEMEFPEDYTKVMKELIKKKEVKLKYPERKLEGYSRTALEEMKKLSESNKVIQKEIFDNQKDITNLIKNEKEAEIKDQQDHIMEAVAYEVEKAKRGRALGQPNEATINKYHKWLSDESGKAPKKKQIEAVEAWLEKTYIAPAAPAAPDPVLSGVPVEFDIGNQEQVAKSKKKKNKKK